MRRDVFQAIADPKRRELITLLARVPMTPNAVSESFEVSRQSISRHLKVLVDCGVLTLTISGREYYYSVNPKKLEEVNNWLNPFRGLWEKRFDKPVKVVGKLKVTTHDPKK